MDKKIDAIYHSAHIVDTLIRHWLEEKIAHEIADIFLANPDIKKYSIHDKQRIDFLDSLTESDNANAWKDYLNSRSLQVINTDKHALEKYLYCSIRNLMKKQKINRTLQWNFHNIINEVGAVIWSKKTLDFINDWQAKNPQWWTNQYAHSMLSVVPWTSIPWSFYSKN